MKHMVTLAVVLTITLLAPLASAAVPQMINYQGRLTDSATGYPYDGNAIMIFSIWDDSSGGTQLWEEIHPTVVVTQGLFNVMLGNIDSIPESVFDQPNSWLEEVVNGDTIKPRTRIVSVGYAYHALRSDTADFALSGGGSGELSGVFRCYGHIPPGGTTTICAGSPFLREITSIVVSSGTTTDVIVRIGGQDVLRLHCTSDGRTQTWHRNNGAGIFVEPNEEVEVFSNDDTYTTVIGYEY